LQISSLLASEVDMPDLSHSASPDPPPAWALKQAAEELHDFEDAQVIRERATEIARERQERHDERHDEYDDPDEGGEG
jgi:predicted secreted Zn-dependent protease